MMVFYDYSCYMQVAVAVHLMLYLTGNTAHTRFPD